MSPDNSDNPSRPDRCSRTGEQFPPVLSLSVVLGLGAEARIDPGEERVAYGFATVASGG